jgi:putative transposase
MAYIELNPVRAGMVATPGDYPWSSFRQNSSGRLGPPLVPHPLYRALGASEAERASAYREIVAAGIGAGELESIRASARKCRALGTAEFCARVETQLERSVTPREQGRPGKRGQDQKPT